VSLCDLDKDAVCGVKGARAFLDNIDHRDVNKPGRIDFSSIRTFHFDDPVILMTPPTTTSPNPAVLRVQFQTFPPGFKTWLATPYPYDVARTPESSSFVTFEKGVGANYFVGSTDLRGIDGFVKITLPERIGLGSRPWVFRQLQSTANGANPAISTTAQPHGLRGYVKTRMSLADNTALTFQLRLEADANPTTAHVPEQETVGYLAIDSGCSQTQAFGDNSNLAEGCGTRYGSLELGGKRYDFALGIYRSSTDPSTVESIQFGKVFQYAPVVLVDLQTSNEAKPLEIRTKTVTPKQYDFVVTSHELAPSPRLAEWVAWLAIGNFQ